MRQRLALAGLFGVGTAAVLGINLAAGVSNGPTMFLSLAGAGTINGVVFGLARIERPYGREALSEEDL